MNQVADVVTSWLNYEAKLALSNPPAAWREFWITFGPGGRLHPGYFLEHHYHYLVEAFLLAGIVYLLAQRRTPIKPTAEALTEKEVQELVSEWHPDPLVPDGAAERCPRAPIVSTSAGSRVTVDGRAGVLNLASHNFWGLAQDPSVLKAARDAVLRYGVGSCGPRGFYGTLTPHVELETALADFLGTEQAIVYSFDAATAPSVLPAFATRKDLIVLDDAAGWPLRNGAALSRAQVLTFRHNDLADLECVLSGAVAEAAAARRPLNRRFVALEGLSASRGDLAPLATVHALCERYRFRLIVDESLSFGAFGSCGRGLCEAAGLSPGAIDIIVGSLATSLGSIGGFCAGSAAVIDHQRLQAGGYCYSASQPPALAASAAAALAEFRRRRPALLAALRRTAGALQRGLAEGLPQGLRIAAVAEAGDLGEGTPSGFASPLAVLALGEGVARDAEEGARIVAQLRDVLLDRHKVLVAIQRQTRLEPNVEPALRVSVTAGHSEADVAALMAALRAACAKVGVC